MNFKLFTLLVLLLIAAFVTSLAILESVFKAGFWAVVVLLMAIVALFIFMFSRVSFTR